MSLIEKMVHDVMEYKSLKVSSGERKGHEYGKSPTQLVTHVGFSIVSADHRNLIRYSSGQRGSTHKNARI